MLNLVRDMTAMGVLHNSIPLDRTAMGNYHPNLMDLGLQNLGKRKVIKQIVQVTQPAPIVNVTANPVVSVQPAPSDDGSDSPDDLLNQLLNLAAKKKKVIKQIVRVV